MEREFFGSVNPRYLEFGWSGGADDLPGDLEA